MIKKGLMVGLIVFFCCPYIHAAIDGVNIKIGHVMYVIDTDLIQIGAYNNTGTGTCSGTGSNPIIKSDTIYSGPSDEKNAVLMAVLNAAHNDHNVDIATNTAGDCNTMKTVIIRKPSYGQPWVSIVDDLKDNENQYWPHW